jgi:excinuclease ABC subunit A
VRKLLEIVHRIVDQGNTVVFIEHNLDVLLSADYIVDLGPEGGEGGGYLVAEGTPEKVAAAEKGYTAKYLKEYIEELDLQGSRVKPKNQEKQKTKQNNEAKKRKKTKAEG